MDALATAQVKTEGPSQADVVEMMMFKNLHDQTVEVTAPCVHCNGSGEKGGLQCPVCQGTRKTAVKMSLYGLAKQMMPLILGDVMKALTEGPRQCGGQ